MAKSERQLVGEAAAAAALPAAGPGCRIVCINSASLIGFGAQVALFGALEAKHGWGFANALAVILNSPPWPPFLNRRGVARGLRRYGESGL